MIWRFGALLLALLLCAAGLWQLSKSRTFQWTGEIVAYGPRDRLVVALTFDDGPSGRYTGAVLETLARADVPATFFVTGHDAEARPALIAQIAAAGHEIGNHSFSHQRMILRTGADLRAEIARTDAAIRAGGYVGPITFRPPYGQKLLVLPWVMADLGRATVMWDVDGDDQGAFAGDPRALADHVIAAAQPGSVILMHVMYDSRETSRAALPMVIEGLRARGFAFVTLAELLGEGQAPG